jgi:hypothetical protein
MSKNNNSMDTEAVLITLDQLGQTIDIMTNVVNKLKGYLTEQQTQTPRKSTPRCDQPISTTVH